MGEAPWERVGLGGATLAVGLLIAPNASFSIWYQDHWDDYPEMIFPRVRHSQAFARRVFLEEPLKPLDMDTLVTMVREMLDPNSWSAGI